MKDDSKQIRILFLSANPLDTSRLRLDEEIRAIDQALRQAKFRDKFDIQQQWAVRVTDLQSYLLRHQPDIVHFSGHGSSASEIILEDRAGNSQPVPIRALSRLFAAFSDTIQCVVLNACYSEEQAKAIAAHIDKVIGMSKAIGDESAISFAAAFYQALGYGKDIQTAFELGCVQIDLEDLGEQDTPKLLKRKKSSSATETNFVKARFSSEPWEKFFEHTYRWLLEDQIDESGGWGKSQYPVMKRISNHEMSHLEKREGGIITTFIALRALQNYEKSPNEFRRKSYARKALNYLLERQTKHGGFGRFVESRSGVEIHPSIRHTAFAISALIDLNGPPEAIARGLRYLSRNWSAENILDDAAPSLAVGGIIYAVDKFITTPTCKNLFSAEEQNELGLLDWSHIKTQLIRELIQLTRSSAFNPFCPPYGHYETMVFDTALTTIDLVSNPLPQTLIPLVVDMLSAIIGHLTNGGIPYNLNLETPDIGMSGYLLSLIGRPGFLDSLGNVGLAWELQKVGDEIASFIIDNYQSNEFRDYTYCDTFANTMLLYPKNN